MSDEDKAINDYGSRGDFPTRPRGDGSSEESAAENPSTLSSGVGDFRIIQRLGAGGMGEVFRGEQVNPRRPVAIKRMLFTGNREALIKAAAAEAELAGQNSIEGIVPIICTAQDDAACYLIMQYIDGGSLLDWMNEGQIPREKVVKILGDLCRILEHLHQRQIVHCDLKPSNILMSRDGRVFLADFGLARRLNEVGLVSGGTPPYEAPELQTGADPTPACDLYSLGVMFYHLLLNRTSGRILDHLIPDEFRDTILRLTDVNARNRHASAAELAAELLNTKPATPPPAPAPDPTPDLAPFDATQLLREASLNIRQGDMTAARADLALVPARARDERWDELFAMSEPNPSEPSPAPAAPQGPEPELILASGKYRLEEFIARGGMGEVWRATDMIAGRKVAIKILPREVRSDTTAEHRVRKSFQKIEGFSHPNICQLYDLSTDPIVGLFLVMRFIDGCTLREYRQRCVEQGIEFGLQDVSRMLRSVAVALDYAHSQNVVHCDVKPQNVLISHDGKEIQVVDFDLAAEVHTSTSQLSHTAFDFGGTLAYVAPEFFRQEPPSPKSDQYSLAVMAYELLTGDLPFASSNPAIVKANKATAEIPPVPAPNHRASAAIKRAAAAEPMSRFATCLEFVEALTSPVRKRRARPVPVRQDGVIDNLVALENKVKPEALTDQHFLRVREFDLRDRGVSDLTRLMKCERLETLNVAGTAVVQLAPLINTTQLTKLDIRRTPVRTIKVLNGLKKLISLRMDQSEVADISVVSRLHRLQTLTLAETPVTDISPVASLSGLTTLVLDGVECSDFSALAGLDSLSQLSIGSTEFSDTRLLDNLNHLQGLKLSDTPINDLGPIGDMYNLRVLSLANTNIATIDDLGALHHLDELSIRGTQVANLEPLSQLTKLRTLRLGNTAVRDIAPLLTLISLQHLQLAGTAVEQLEDLRHLPSLQTLKVDQQNTDPQQLRQLQLARPKLNIIVKA